jgi:hypothetical protein
MTETAAYSPFAQSFKSLLDETAFFSRTEWSQYFQVSERVLEDWVSDRALPDASKLRMALDLLRMRGKVKEPIERFEALFGRPVMEISPFGAFISPSLEAYLKQFSLVKLGKKLRYLSPDQAQRVLRGSWDADSIATLLQAHPPV